MAYVNSADPDQTAPEGAVWRGSTLFAFPLFFVFKKQLHKKQHLGQKHYIIGFHNFRTFILPILKPKQGKTIVSISKNACNN